MPRHSPEAAKEAAKKKLIAAAEAAEEQRKATAEEAQGKANAEEAQGKANAEEEQRKANAEEAQGKANAEEAQRKAEEAQRKANAEEAQLKAEEAQLKANAEEAQLKAAEAPKKNFKKGFKMYLADIKSKEDPEVRRAKFEKFKMNKAAKKAQEEATAAETRRRANEIILEAVADIKRRKNEADAQRKANAEAAAEAKLRANADAKLRANADAKLRANEQRKAEVKLEWDPIKATGGYIIHKESNTLCTYSTHDDDTVTFLLDDGKLYKDNIQAFKISEVQPKYKLLHNTPLIYQDKAFTFTHYLINLPGINREMPGIGGLGIKSKTPYTITEPYELAKVYRAPDNLQIKCNGAMTFEGVTIEENDIANFTYNLDGITRAPKTLSQLESSYQCIFKKLDEDLAASFAKAQRKANANALAVKKKSEEEAVVERTNWESIAGTGGYVLEKATNIPYTYYSHDGTNVEYVDNSGLIKKGLMKNFGVTDIQPRYKLVLYTELIYNDKEKGIKDALGYFKGYITSELEDLTCPAIRFEYYTHRNDRMTGPFGTVKPLDEAYIRYPIGVSNLMYHPNYESTFKCGTSKARVMGRDLTAIKIKDVYRDAYYYQVSLIVGLNGEVIKLTPSDLSHNHACIFRKLDEGVVAEAKKGGKHKTMYKPRYTKKRRTVKCRRHI